MSKLRKLKVYEPKLDEVWKVEVYSEVEKNGFAEFAKCIGTSDVTVQQWLFTGREPSITHKGKLVYYFKDKNINISFSELPEADTWQEELFKVFLEKGIKVIAKELEVSKDTIYYWVTEKKIPNDESFERIEKYLKK